MCIVKVKQLNRYIPMTGITSAKMQQKDMPAQVFINQQLVREIIKCLCKS